MIVNKVNAIYNNIFLILTFVINRDIFPSLIQQPKSSSIGP